MEVIGAVASTSQLIGLCVKSSQVLAALWQSYTDAPAELRTLSEKIARLRFLIEQIQALCDEASAHSVRIDDLLPEAHRSFIVAILQDRVSELENLKSLRRDHGAFKAKARWATLDKSKADRLIIVVRNAEQDLNTCLAITNT